MILRLAFRRLIPLLAVLGLAFAPVAAPAAAAGMRAPSLATGTGGAHGHHVAPGERPCPGEAAAIDLEEGASPGCPEGCLLMAFGPGGTTGLLHATPFVPEPSVTGVRRPRSEPLAFASLHGAPPPEPPRA